VANKLSKTRRALLVQLETILGNECYNANIQNYGPFGSREADGRSFRYPLTVREHDGKTQKIRSYSIPNSVSDEALRSGYYAFGANQLDVMSGIERILEFLEEKHGLVIRD
jgi:hypothetical protein